MNYTFKQMLDCELPETEQPLLSNFTALKWSSHTTALLHSRRNVDKRAALSAIMLDLTACTSDVLYIDIDGLAHKFDYAIRSSRNIHQYNPRFEPGDRTKDFADIVLGAIEKAVETTGIRVFVVDSITRMATLSFGRNASAAYLMKRLVALQVRLGISILVVAHDYNRSATDALVAMADSHLAVTERVDSEEHQEPEDREEHVEPEATATPTDACDQPQTSERPPEVCEPTGYAFWASDEKRVISRESMRVCKPKGSGNFFKRCTRI